MMGLAPKYKNLNNLEFAGIAFNHQKNILFRESKPLENEEIADRAAVFIITLKDEEIKDLKIKDAAKAADIDNLKLSRIFKNELGISITEFIKREIIYRAVFAIDKEPDISIKNLAGRLGFATIEKFEKEFYKYYLIKPGRYKERVSIRNNSSAARY